MKPDRRWRPAALCVALLLAAAGARAAAWQPADSSYAWRFPEDHWAHPSYRTEWWYLTAQLVAEDDPAARFGVQFTVFRIGLTPAPADTASAWAARDLIMGHAAIGDFTAGAGKHHFSELVHRASPLLGGFGVHPDTLIAWSLAPAGTDARWTLEWNGEAFTASMADSAQGMAFRLETRPLKPLALQGPNGYSRKGAGPSSASQYYSFTRLAVTGTLRVEGREQRVRGEGWFDKEFGSNQLEPQQAGWDWFSLQLADGRELMLYQLRDKQGRPDWRRGTLIAADGAVTLLGPSDWQVEAAGEWKSPATGTRYPERWRLRVAGAQLELEVIPRLLAQENVGARSGLHYWEGAVEVRGPDGAPRGQGYVELVGLGGGRPLSF